MRQTCLKRTVFPDWIDRSRSRVTYGLRTGLFDYDGSCQVLCGG